MRFASFAFAPANHCTQQVMMSLGRLIGAFGPLLSTTNMSPLGRTYRDRGCSRPVANGWICNPCGTLGFSPFPHPTAFAIRIGGMKYCCSAGSTGLAPICLAGSPALLSQPASPRPAIAKSITARRFGLVKPVTLSASIVLTSSTRAVCQGRASQGRQQENDNNGPGKHQAGRYHRGIAVAAVNE